MLFFLFPAAAGAEIYKYVDENGNVTLTDTPRGGDTELLYSSEKKKRRDEDVQHIIVKKANKYRLDPSLISAVIKTESAFDSRAVSRRGAMGLMQLMPGTARDLGVINPFNPEENIEGGTRYLKHLIDKYDGDITRALAAYNAGPRRAEKPGGLPNETRNYIRKVYSLYNGERRIEPTEKKENTVIYKIVLEDGSVLFTNHIPGNAL